jgi:GNAT superfamily N-acetyltransferase
MTVVRIAVPGDAAAIARVHVEGWRGGYGHVFPHDRLASLSVDRRREGWRRQLDAQRDPARTFVAEDGERVVGFADVSASRDSDANAARVGELNAIYVLPDDWGRGFGQELMAAALSFLAAVGFEEARLWVLEDNPRARRFYEAAGWWLDGASKEDTFLDTRVTEVRYRIALPLPEGARAPRRRAG